MQKVLIVLALLCLVGCGNETIDMLHPSRELAELPILQVFDKILQLTGQIKWIKEGLLWENWEMGVIDEKHYSHRKYTEFFPAYVPEEMIGKTLNAFGDWYWCPDCEKWIPDNYKNCPICDREMKRKYD